MNADTIEVSLEASLTGHQNPIFTLALSKTRENILFTGGNDKGVVEWDLETMSFRRILCKVNSSVYSLLTIEDTSLLAIGMRSGQIMIVDADSQSLKANLQVEKGAVFSIKTIPEKKELIAIGEEGVAYVWSLETYELLYRFKVADTTVRVIAVQPSSKTLAFGDKNGEIHLFSAKDFQEIEHQKIHELPVTSLVFENDDYLLSGGRDAKLYKLNANNLTKIQELVPHMFTVYSLENNTEYNLIASVSRDKTLKIWRTEDLSLVKNISRDKGYDSHYLSINAMIWNKNRIITVSDDKTVKIWRLTIR